jgi:hypothetical protein
MNFARRQHNATILPDGTVLVTGGTRGGGAGDEAFNNLNLGQPVHIAELWDPRKKVKTGQWTMLAAEQTDRCYHSTAVLLPDGRVLSAGGGEFLLNEGTPQQVANDPKDTHTDAQLFDTPALPILASASRSRPVPQTTTSQPSHSERCPRVRSVRASGRSSRSRSRHRRWARSRTSPESSSDVRTLCDANSVNNPQVSTMDGSWLIQAYPAGTPGFSMYDGTSLQCQGTAASGTIAVSSTARTITVRVPSNQPNSVRRDNVILPQQGTPGSGVPGWRYDAAAGFTEVGFTHSGETTIVEL